MSQIDSGPLATYNSLQDKHLVGYFNNTRMRRHLRRSGLITRNGEIVMENTFRLNMARREHQKHVRDLLAQAIVHKALDMERHRQGEIKRKLEEIAKIELVQRVRSSKGRRGDEDITPYLSPRAPSGRPKSAKQERPRLMASVHRPATAPSKQTGTTKKKSAIYVDKEGFPVHRDQVWGSVDDDNNEVDSHNLRELDPCLLNDITRNMTQEEKQTSPYKIDLTFQNPKPPSRPHQGSKKSPRGPSSRTVVTRDGRRIRPKSNKGSLSLHRKEPAYPHPTQQQTLCDVTVHYRGNNLKLQYEREDRRDEVIIHQQHCGGENLVVFHGLVEPGTDLVFTSRRHRGFPFSLTFFVNQIQVLRLSACCEYKYGPGVILGGRKGHFKFGRVDGGSPCYRCMVEAELARRERQRYKDTQTDEPKPEQAPEPILESQGTQSDPPPPKTREESQQAEAAAAAATYDDDEFEDDDQEKADSQREGSAKAEDNSDHFFSCSESDIEQRQSAEAGFEADSEFEADSIHEEQEEEEKDEFQEKRTAESDNVQEPNEDEVLNEEVIEEQDGTISVPEAPYKSDDDKDEQQSSRNENDSSSDSRGHNRVLSTSSSSSSSEDEDKKYKAKAAKDAGSSTSDFSSEDEGQERKNHIKQKKPPIAEETFSDDEKEVQRLEEHTKQDIGKEQKLQTDVNVPYEKKEANEEGMESPPGSEVVDSTAIVSSTKEEIKEADSEPRDSEYQEDNDQSFVPKLAGKVRDSFSSDSDQGDGEKRRKKKKESKSKSNTSDTSRSGSDTDNSKSFFEKLEATFVSSDSDSNSSSDDENGGKCKSDLEKFKNTDAINVAISANEVESKESQHQDTQSEEEREENQRLQEDEEPSSSLSVGREGEEDEEEPTESKEEKILIDKTEGSSGSEDDIDKKEEEDPITAVKLSKESEEDIQRASEFDKEPTTNEAEEAEADSLSQKQDERPKSPEPPKDKPAEILAEQEVRTDNMFGPPDSDTDSKSGSEKAEVREHILKSEEEIMTSTAPRNLGEVEPMSTSSDEKENQLKDIQREPDSELERDSETNTAEEAKAKAEEEASTSPQKQEEQINSPEPLKGENPAEIFQERGVGMNDMVGPRESDTDSKSDGEKTDEPMSMITEEDELKGEKSDSAPTDLASEQQSDESHQVRDDAASGKEEGRKEDEPKGGNATSDEQADDDYPEMSTSGQHGTTETFKEKPEDEVDGKKEDLKEEINENGSITSSVSDSGSIADGLDKDFRVLNLNAKDLNEEKVPKLARALRRHKYDNLEHLLLRDNPLTDTGVATVIRALLERHNEATSTGVSLELTNLDLGNSGMGDEAAAELSKLLALPDIRLQDLNVSENHLSAAGWAAVIDGLKVNKSIVTFTAEHAHLSDTSCVILADALVEHEKLQELKIEGNGLGDRAGKALIQLVKENSIITRINLEEDNAMSQNIISEVKEILETGSYVP